jgi:cytochrome o ubiquinol oxidase operon protein cyoD
MSGTSAGHDGHGHGQGHEGGGHGGGGPVHATLKGYLTGFVLSIILTAIPFWLVMTKAMGSTTALGIVLLLLGAVQIVVHMFYFLHMNAKSEAGWTMLALIFTLVLVFIALSGSLWVMYHLNQNMMPVTPQQMRNAP